MNSKVCASCKVDKPLTDYSKRKAASDGLHYYCRICSAAKCKEDKQKHAEKRLLAERESREKNKDTRNRKKRERYAQNPEVRDTLKEKAKRWTAENREKKRAASEAWRINNRAKWNAMQQKSRWVNIERHRERWRIISSTRRSRLNGADGVFTVAEWNAMKTDYDHTCLSCGKKEPEIQLTIDHVVPISQGGANSAENIQPLCLSCNSSKNATAIDYRLDRKNPRVEIILREVEG